MPWSPWACGWQSLCPHLGGEEPGADSGSPYSLEPPKTLCPPFAWQHPDLFSTQAGEVAACSGWSEPDACFLVLLQGGRGTTLASAVPTPRGW